MERTGTDYWFNDAECLTMDSEIFFDKSPRLKALAKEACQRCEVVADCLLYAYQTDSNAGIYGGRTPAERDSLRRRKPNNQSLEAWVSREAKAIPPAT